MIFDKLFQLMAERRASDIFVSAGTPVHIKINGVVMPINQQIMEPAVTQRMAYEIMTPEQIAHFEKERELNISHSKRGLGNFRINFFWQRNSVSIVVRYIQGEIPSLETLNLPPVLYEIIMEKRGLVLVVGATGSGKSTTIASMLDYRNNNTPGHILTVEDPIEYLFRHKRSVVNQREVGFDTKSWHEALKNAMRQAPDCILIGEIRDLETMKAAISYAQSGHLVLATLHANNAHHALNRITSFYPLESRELLFLDLSVSLRSVISQRLVKKPDGSRIPAAEILMNTRHIAELIQAGNFGEVREAMEKSLAQGSQTFEQDLFRLYRSGVITLEEALTNSDSPTNFSWLVNNTPSESADAPKTPAQHDAITEFEPAEEDGASFSSFTLHMDETS
ncbi:MAG: type IV pili twitching motility protein PilT [Candidatus Dactylopiibacterium carminicum]|uniref:Type IV pili twitching motility protein PilT n=1 Tax=Candidatus Dactylopiibacterium carminicum TaxID=857335 RepID=A0A272EXN6_9RHOO|nr:PilT/PilU family type 4a pilus ATPase [Candidatus Dactylopiibacterium carminicum]KAF7600547.1 type IV pili twitching motility protein PilT [Candidatus Dactylopiibacterium carminicum]PAS94884.1 MAG: type IV pili twitching motility protein PilT [Candidatus Dactylopiibacterium carminicum]PAS98020.1 MAG: type IV pili twitching motility protein PilT [Candidatus Dactylopiibacterium carminicum]PAT00551.1 MAG: type IV pili twitching motility protein PilT [Candidatus Dactylopiibacterium carminicum]